MRAGSPPIGAVSGDAGCAEPGMLPAARRRERRVAREEGGRYLGNDSAMAPERSERELLSALAEGDRQAAEALVDLTYGKVFGLMCRLCGSDGELAADLTQDAYRRAWSALGSFDGRAQFSTWLYRIAYNAFLNHVRRPLRVLPMEDEQAALVPDRASRADDTLIAAEAGERLRRAVLALPDDLRAVVVARFWTDAPVAEIAGVEGLSETAIRKRLRKALALLADALEGVG